MRRSGLLFAIAIFLALTGLSARAQTKLEWTDEPGDPPFGVFPHLRTVREDPKPMEGLGSEIQGLSKQVETTVKTFAEQRNFNCFGPCQIQAFPLLFTRANSGFFGGVRANIVNVARTNPSLYSIDIQLVRSDTKQWESFIAFDFPRITFLPFNPRFKVKGTYQRSTESHWYGVGPASAAAVNLPDDTVRYGHEEEGYQSVLIIPIIELSSHQLSFFTNFASIKHRPYRFRPQSLLYDQAPIGIQGGISSRAGVGLILDSRDREVLPRSGWMIEGSGETSLHYLGSLPFQRFSVINRGYLSSGRWTLASRVTFDSLSGDVPFWELSGIGGTDPIRDVNGSGILQGYSVGRFHERTKLIGSLELRDFRNPFKWWGLYNEVVWLPVGVDGGRVGEQNALSAFTGVESLVNHNLLIRTLVAYSTQGFSINLQFGQDF